MIGNSQKNKILYKSRSTNKEFFMEDKVLEIISKVTKFTISELKTKSAENSLWDSLKHMEIVLALEEAFDITFGNDDIAEARTVNKMIETVKNKAEQ